MGLILPNPNSPQNEQAFDATPIKQNQDAIAQAIQSFDGSQIQPATVQGSAMAANVNPNTILHDTIQPFVQSGCVWTSPSGLTVSMTSGVVYVGPTGAIDRVMVSAVSSKTLTASQDTYIDIDYNGNVYYQAVANNAASPSLTAHSVRVAKIVTSGTAVTSVVQNGLDSLGNYIYPSGAIYGPALADSAVTGAKLATNAINLGWIQTAASNQFSIGSSETMVNLSTGTSFPVTIPAGGRDVMVSFILNAIQNTSSANLTIKIKDGGSGGGAATVSSANLIVLKANILSGQYNPTPIQGFAILSAPAAGTRQFGISLATSGGTLTVDNLDGGVSQQGFLMVKVI